MEILTLPNNPSLSGMARLDHGVVYSTATGTPLTAAILTPWNKEIKKRPALVFVQGSGWKCPDIGTEIPQLAAYARAGYVVMTILHRNREDGHPFPAFLQDVKCALRFLRAHQEKYHVDPDRIALWGTSSGGNAALLAAMTGDDPRYATKEYAEYSDKVNCMVECFGPTWLEQMPLTQRDLVLVDQLRGERSAQEVMAEMSPYCIAREGEDYPPMLLLHGDADTVVPYDQSVALYDKLKAMGKRVSMIRVKGAGHELSFWTEDIHRYVLSFLDAHLM